MLVSEVDVVQWIKGRRHKEKGMVKCTRKNVIVVSCKTKNKFTGK